MVRVYRDPDIMLPACTTVVSCQCQAVSQQAAGQLDQLDDAGGDLGGADAVGLAAGQDDLDGLGYLAHAALVMRAERAAARGPRAQPRFTWLRVRPWAFFHSRQPLAVRPSNADAALEGLRKR